MMGFGGPSAYYGCFHCQLKGTWIRSLDHVYYYGVQGPSRNARNLKEDWEAHRYGIRELPAFYTLQCKLRQFDCIKSAAIDVMHGVCY
jgi:hypothetical protein